MLTITLIFEPLEHKAFLTTWCITYLFSREMEVFFLNTLKISLAPNLQKRTFSSDACGDSAAKEAK